MTRVHAWPEGHWNWPITVTHRHGVRDGDLCFVGGQVDLSPSGEVLHPGDLEAQTPAALANLERVLAELGAGLGDLVKLVVYYVDVGTGEDALVEHLASLLPDGRPALAMVPVPYLAYPQLLIEIEAVAAFGAKERVGADAFCDGIRCGELIWTSSLLGATPREMVAQTREAMERLSAVLAAFGADLDDAVKLNIFYVGTGSADDWEVSARIRASYFHEPGPVATGIPVPRLHDDAHVIRMDVWAMRGVGGERLARRHSWPAGHWDWPIHLPYKHGLRCGQMLFVGGQVSLTPQGEPIDFDDVPRQTRRSLENIEKVLDGLGARLDDTVKVTAFYEGSGAGDDLHENLAIRSEAFSAPGPATTGIPLPYLAYDGMVIEIEVIGMVAP